MTSPEDFLDELPPDVPVGQFHDSLFWAYDGMWLVGAGFWIWMLVHCIRNDPDRNLWIWILLIGNLPGALVYFFVRWLPGRTANEAPTYFKRWTSGRKLAKLEHAARHIGNAHQWLELGDLQRELFKPAAAADSYQKALKKDPLYLPALWGAALADIDRQQDTTAKQHLQTILSRDPSYKFGDVSLALGRTLVKLNDSPAARTHLEQHVQRWTHPEGIVLLATLLADAGEAAEARNRLEAMLSDLAAAPAYFARQQRRWGRQARALLKRLPC